MKCSFQQFMVLFCCISQVTSTQPASTNTSISESEQTRKTVSPKLWTRMSVDPTNLESQNVWGESIGQHLKLPTDMGTLIGTFLNQPVVSPLGQYFDSWTMPEIEHVPGPYGHCYRYESEKTIEPNSFIPLVHMRHLNLMHNIIRSMYLEVKVSKKSSRKETCPQPQYMLQSNMEDGNNLKYSPFPGTDVDKTLIGTRVFHLKPHQWPDNNVLGLYIPRVPGSDCEYVFDHYAYGFDIPDDHFSTLELNMFVFTL